MGATPTLEERFERAVAEEAAAREAGEELLARLGLDRGILERAAAGGFLGTRRARALLARAIEEFEAEVEPRIGAPRPAVCVPRFATPV